MKRALVIAVLAACGGKSAPPAASSRDAVVEIWRSGGLSPTPFTPAKLPIGDDCATGAVDGVDVALCTFPTADAAKAAEPAGLAWVGETTGISRARGVILVAAADRKKADPHGKTLDKLTKLLPKP